MTDTIHIEIKGMKELQAALAKFPREVKKYMEQAGREAAVDVILKEPGVQKYPPETEANLPPTPYYKRGVGMVYKGGTRETSEKLSTQWTVSPVDFKTTISNRASYAKWVHGEQQARFMAPKGWRKLFDVAKEKGAQITVIYNRWTNKLLRDIKLKK